MNRNLSGIYIRHDKDNVCFEDLPKEAQNEWLDTLDEKAVKRLVKMLADTLKNIGDELDLYKE